MRFVKLILGLFFFSILLVGCHNERLEKPVVMSFLACGDGDITLIQNGEYSVLIDTGEDVCQDNIAASFEKKQISKIDLMILSHPDKDHIGNALYIMKKWDVRKIYASNYQKGSELEQALLDYVKTNHIDYEVIENDKNITLGELEILIEPPKKKYDSSNNSSLITYVKTGKIRTFFGADIKRERIEEVKQTVLKSDIVKLPYHGRYIKNLEVLLKQLQPEYVIITSETANEKTSTLLKNLNINYELTEQDVVIEIDGVSWKRGA